MTKRERIRLWGRRHEDAIIFGGAGTLMVVLFVVAIKANISYQARMAAELDGYIDSLNELYASLADGAL